MSYFLLKMLDFLEVVVRHHVSFFHSRLDGIEFLQKSLRLQIRNCFTGFACVQSNGSSKPYKFGRRSGINSLSDKHRAAFLLEKLLTARFKKRQFFWNG